MEQLVIIASICTILGFFASIFLNWNRYKKRFIESRSTLDKFANLLIIIFALFTMLVSIISIFLFYDTIIYQVKSYLSGDIDLPENNKLQGQVAFFLTSFCMMTWFLFIRFLMGNQYQNHHKGIELVIALFAFCFFSMMHILNYDFIKIYNVIISTIQRYVS